jgi:hypothetical protein
MCHRDDRPLNDQLVFLIGEALHNAPKSYKRRRALNCLVTLMHSSGRLWRGGGSIEPEDLAEAESRTWLFICNHLNDYEANRGGVINWYNNILKWRIHDIWREKGIEMRRFVGQALDEDGEPMFAQDPAAPAECPDILTHIHQWLDDNQAEFKAIHMRDRPHIHCYGLMRARLPDQDIPWVELADRFGVSISSLSGFYQKQCWRRLRRFGEDKGYLDPDT